jgi:hypothetical protein
MRLTTARLCLDCEEIHHDELCPACASETSVYLTRWIPQIGPSSVKASQRRVNGAVLTGDSRRATRAVGCDAGRGVAALRALQPETAVASPEDVGVATAQL